MPRKLPLPGPFLNSRELVADVIAVAESVEHVLPVAAAEDERLAVCLLPGEELGVDAPPGVEVHVLDPADVVDLIDEDPAAQRLAADVADQVADAGARVDPLVGVEQLDVEHGRVVAAHGDGVGIRGRGHGFRVGVGVGEDHAAERAVGVEREECGGVLLAPVGGDEERRAEVTGPGQPRVADPVVRRDALEAPFERHADRDVEASREAIVRRGCEDRPAAGPPGCVEGALERGGVVGLSVSPAPKSRTSHEASPGRRPVAIGACCAAAPDLPGQRSSVAETSRTIKTRAAPANTALPRMTAGRSPTLPRGGRPIQQIALSSHSPWEETRIDLRIRPAAPESGRTSHKTKVTS